MEGCEGKTLEELEARNAVHVAHDEIGLDAPGDEGVEAGIGGADETEVREPGIQPGARRRFSSRNEQGFHEWKSVGWDNACQEACPGQPRQYKFDAMRSIHPPKELFDFAREFEKAGKKCYLVGGAVRDCLLGREASDFDVATDARPEEVLRLFRRVIPTGIKHGTVTVLWRGLEIEATTFRTESDYADGRHPDKVEFAATIEEDLSRRDFTINAMAFDLALKSLVDPLGGQEDLRRRLVRAVGDPLERFREDGLRPLRALRFAAQLGFEVDAATLAAIAPSIGRFRLVSVERVRVELQKILLSASPGRGLRLLEETGLLKEISPALASCRGVEQRGMHVFDVLDHLYASVEASPPELELRLASLFHDVGKPEAKVEEPGKEPSFHRHEEYSARITEAELKRLRFPNAVVDGVVHLIRCHMFSYDESWSDAAVRRFIARVGIEHIDSLFALRIADGTGIIGRPVDPRSLTPLRNRIDAVIAAKEAFGLADLAVKGGDLASIGVPSGRAMGAILKELLETVMDDPELNERERLLEIARRIKPKYGL
jgi:tRNA nucleotidyltransferase (CCA-adding enzyme)